MEENIANNETIEEQVLQHEVNVRPATDIVLIFLRDYPISVAKQMRSYNCDCHLIEEFNMASKATRHGVSICIVHVY